MEGLIIINSKKGYTMLEMMVTMTIMILVMGIGGTVFLQVRDQQRAKDMAEQFKADIRRTQVKALSTEGDCGAGERPRMWGLVYYKNAAPAGGYNLKYYCASTNNWRASTSQMDNVRFSTGTTLLTENRTGGVYSPDASTVISFVFSPPNGDFFMANSDLTAGSLANNLYGTYKPNGTRVTSDKVVRFTFRGKTFSTLVNGFSGSAERI